ncbi:helix-turn-helix domain-containing protein [Candidatus Woesearchaeota archaeon]|nr:helix-turn-helix domain-containing protein [Candidatus Woesearchaeota archaeon]
MTTIMDFTDFVAIGFNVNEAKVYVVLLSYGRADARTLVKELKVHKNIVYDNLQKLMDKGVVSSIIEGTRSVFFPEPPSALEDYLHQKENQLKQQQTQLKRLTKDITLLKQKTLQTEEARIFQGVQGVRRAFHELYAEASSYVAYGGALTSVDVMGDAFWLRNHVIQQEKNISCKLIFNESLRSWMKQSKAYTDEDLRFLEKEFEPLTETIIWNDKTMIIIWTNEPVVTLIHNKVAADSNRAFFNLLWKQAKN